jgi:chorismate dehydratase
MDINGLFNRNASGTETPVQTRTRNLSLVSYLNTKPLVYGLEQELVNHEFTLQKDVPSVCADRLIEGEVELGIIPSIEYARGKGALRIIPDLSIASQGKVKSVNLFFNPEAKQINTVALDTSSRTSVALLKILLKEKYELDPDFVVMPPDLDSMLSKADAALVIGDKALHFQAEYPNYFDLAEEWNDLTGLPFVFAFWAGHEFALKDEDVEAIKKSYELGKQHIKKIATEYAKSHPQTAEFYAAYLTDNISFAFSEEEKAALDEFYRYAFYYGLIEHIPELHFYGE